MSFDELILPQHFEVPHARESMLLWLKKRHCRNDSRMKTKAGLTRDQINVLSNSYSTRLSLLIHSLGTDVLHLEGQEVATE